MACTSRLVVAAVSVACLVGCSSRPARREDNSGTNPKVNLAANLTPGKYAAVVGLTAHVQAIAGRDRQSVDASVHMDYSTMVAMQQPKTIATMSVCRLKVKMPGINIDTDEPLLPKLEDPKMVPSPEAQAQGVWYVKKMLHQLLGPEVEWEILPDGRCGELLKNQWDSAITNSDLAKSFGPLMPYNNGCAGGMTGVYPKQPVGVGGIWHAKRMSPAAGPMDGVEVEVEYELTALEDSPDGQIATIEYRGYFNKDLNTTTDKGATIGKVDLTMEGVMHVMTASGLAKDNTCNVTLDCSVSLNGKDGKAKVKMEIKCHQVKDTP